MDLGDAADIRTGVEAAKMQLVDDGFPELAHRLASLLSALHTCTSCSVQGTQAQELSAKPLVTHFTEHEALLRLFLSLKGSSPSIRRRQTTFQTMEGTLSTSSTYLATFAVDEESTSSNQQQALTSSVFAEAPNPSALFDLHGTCVLLPSEIFSNKGNRNSTTTSAAAAAAAAAGAQGPETELAELSQGLQARPSWAPASVQGLPPLYSGGWLPITPALMEMRGDTRKVVPPAPLNVPLSTLAIERTPGAVTGFSCGIKARSTDKGGGKSIGGIKDSPVESSGNGNLINPAAAEMDKVSTMDKKTLLGSGTLWTLEESQLARDALLSLQGVYSSLLRLRGALAAAHALPHPAASGILNRIERAASCRHRLQIFIDAFGSIHRITNSSSLFDSTAALQNNDNNKHQNNKDPVLSALAAGLNDILLSFSQQLSSLETSHATEWVHTINLAAADGGPGIRGKVLQGQGLSLTRVAVLTGKVQTMLRVLSSMFWCNDVTADQGNGTRCEWEVGQGPPRGPALLSLLCHYAEEAEEPYKEIFQYLFARAAQPYLLFLQQWACTTTEIDLEHPYSVIMPTNNILGTAQPEASEYFGLGNQKNTRPQVAIPANLPDFLSHIESPLLRAGVQLRLLHSIRKDECKELVAALKNRSGLAQDTLTATAVAGDDAVPIDIEDIFCYSLEAPPMFDALGSGLKNSNSNIFINGIREKANITAGGGDGDGGEVTSSLLLLPKTSLEIEGLIKQNNQEKDQKTAAVDTWLDKLKTERWKAEAAERGAALGAATLASEAIASKETAKMEALSRRQSQKQELLKEQLEAIASVHLARGGRVARGNNAYQEREEKEEGKSNKNEKVADIDEVYVPEQQDERSVDIGTEKAEKKEDIESNRGTTPTTTTTTRIPSFSVVPLSTTIETAFTSTISLQYRLTSHACLRFFIDHLHLENHLSFLRCTFFLEAGDWADEFLEPLSSRIAALQPLSAHSVHGALQDSLSNSSLGKKSDFLVLAQNLEAEILAGPTAISSFFTCLERQQQGSNKAILCPLENSLEILATGNLPRNRASAPVLVSPTALDGLDIVLLRYKTSWPLAALLTEDTSLAYAAVFSAMLRVRRVSAALTKIWGPLAPRLSEAPTIRPSEKTTRRVQKLRVFVRSASQLTAAVQYFQGLTTAGPTRAALSNAVRSSGGGTIGESTRLNTKMTSVSDLQELLEMHRKYVFTSAIQCLTLCGKKVLQNGIDAALHAALTVASKIETAAEAGRVASGPRSTEAAWVHSLSNDTTWNTIETSIIEFESAVKAIRKELTGVGVSGPLAGLAAVL